MLRAVAYCRVSTEKAAQLDSYAAQKEFFVFYCQKCGYALTRIYGDEGKSGVRMSTRPALSALLQDAEAKKFDIVLVKDVSRLARNVVDFLSAIRRLKALGITVIFVNSDLSSSEGSEFTLTILSAIAQEESASLSRRIKFGKQIGARQGRVPNFVFGYHHIDRFCLEPDTQQAADVRWIFEQYVNHSESMRSIARMLNEQGKRTCRNCQFTAKSIQRILTNPLYCGRLFCSKSEVSDFLTGQRRFLPADKQNLHFRKELQIISDELFEEAQQRMQKRHRSIKKVPAP